MTTVMTAASAAGLGLAGLADRGAETVTLWDTVSVALFLIPIHLMAAYVLSVVDRLGSRTSQGHVVAFLVPAPLLIAPVLVGLNPVLATALLGVCLLAGALVCARLP